MTNSPQQKLGITIKEKRRQKNLSQSELGKAIHYSRSAIAGFEQGNRELKAIALFSLAEALDCSVEELNPFSTKATL